jgi:DNA-directed RNA polymerase subunit RPC12/RpoP
MMLHEEDELTCPRCGEVLNGDFGTVDTKISNESDQVRTEIDCPDCDAPLDLVIESALPDALGFDIWVEDRRDES